MTTTTTKDSNRIDRRFFEITTRNKKAADAAAMEYLGIKDESLLDYKIINLGSKLFVFFGPSKITYKYFIKPVYKKLLLPFIIEIIKKTDLKLYAKVFYKDPIINISITGKDENLLKENRFELTQSLEHLSRQYLNKKVVLPKDIKITVNKDFKFNESRSNSRTRDSRKGGQRERKNSEKWLKQLAEKTMKKVLETNEPVLTQEFNPADRRIIHQTVNGDDENNSNGKFKSESIGDGRFKKIQISLQ